MEAAAIFGRERELALGEAFLEAGSDRIRVMRLEGEAGIGKTTLWRELVRRAALKGFRVLSSRPAQSEARLALSALTDLLEPLSTEAFGSLPAPQRRALEIALLRAAPDGEALDPRTLATGVRSVLGGLAVGGPLLVAIDDIQWLDASSAMVLDFALRRLSETSLAGLFALRVPERARLATDGAIPAESLTRVQLRALTRPALRQLLSGGALPSLSRPALVRIHSASGGNPLFALELARELDRRATAQPGTQLPVPPGLRELLSERVPELAPEAGEALLAAAALSRPTSELVERASSARRLAAAEESGLIWLDGQRIVFAHPLYASAVYESASRARRRQMHAQLAQLVSDPEERARHLAASVTEPDERVAEALERASAAARQRGAWEAAADLLERARELTPTDRGDAARRRGIQAAEHHVHAGDRSRARRLTETLLSEPLSRPMRADALRLLAEISYNDQNVADARRRFLEALSYADDQRVAATIELGLGYLSGHGGDPGSGAPHAHKALALAESVGDPALLGSALAMCSIFDYLGGHGVDWKRVNRALELEEPDTIMPLLWRPSTIAAILLLYVHRFSEAREKLTAVSIAARERGDESDLGFVLLWLGWLETRTANFGPAAALSDEAASVAALTGSESTRAICLAQRALVHAFTGDVADTQRLCAEACLLLERMGNAWVTVWVAAALATLEVSRSDPQAALDACEGPLAALERDGIGEPVPAFFLPDALEALIARGELGRAEPLLDQFERRGQELDRVWAIATGARCRALLLAARGDRAGAQVAVEQALSAHARLDMPVEQARTLLVRGVLERRARRRAQAKRSFEQALEIFERTGARLWAARARQELDRLGLRRSSSDELTAGERRVARLAAQGLTNRQVADELYLSPKTVESNLSRVYRKLGIGSRAELGALAKELLQE